MRRRSLLSAALICCLLLLAACSSGVPKRKSESQPEVKDGKTAIRFAFFRPYGSLDPLVKEFERTHKEYQIIPVPIEVEWPSATDLDGKADLFYSSSLPDRLIKTGGALDLEPYIRQSNVDLDAYKLHQSQYMIDGRIYGLPVKADPRTLLANVDLFEKAGVSLPGASWTWDQFREVAKKLTTADGKQWGLDSNAPELLTQLRIMQYKVGIPATLADEKAWTESLQLMTTVTQTDKSAAPIPQDGYGPLQRSGDPKEFLTGKAAMGMGWAGMRPPFKHAMLPMPTIPNAKPVTYAWFFSLAIPTKSEQPDAAWEFIRWATGPEGALFLAKNNTLPMYFSPEIETAWASQQPKGAEAITRSLWMGHAGNPGLNTLMDRAINSALTGGTPWEKAVAGYMTESAPLKNK